MSILNILDIRGDEEERQILTEAAQLSDFPGELLVPELEQQWGKTKISAEFADLSVTQSVVYREDVEDVGYDDYVVGRKHEGAHRIMPNVESRNAVLGTAWTDGRIYIDESLKADPERAKLIFLFEFSHQVDFFVLNIEQREEIWDIYHAGEPESDIGAHGHGWFDVGPYKVWVGESLMAGITLAYLKQKLVLPPDQFAHPTTPEIAIQIRRVITPELGLPQWVQEPDPEVPSEPEPEPKPTLFELVARFFRAIANFFRSR